MYIVEIRVTFFVWRKRQTETFLDFRISMSRIRHDTVINADDEIQTESKYM